jgi:hypothetical protein
MACRRREREVRVVRGGMHMQQWPAGGEGERGESGEGGDAYAAMACRRMEREVRDVSGGVHMQQSVMACR